MSDPVYSVMLSSTYRDLIEHRQAVEKAAKSQRMFADMMEDDPGKPDQGIIESSLEKVNRADAYVVLISNYRYGQVIDDPVRNPDGLSVTELEFRRAEELNIPICVFLMGDRVPIDPVEAKKERLWEDKLAAFRERAKDPSRIYQEFSTIADLELGATKTLARLKTKLQERAPAKQSLVVEAPPPSNGLPTPPAFHAQPPYIPSHHFQGRARELELLRSWATSPHDPVLVFEAIGGMGKSMVTWEWTTNHAPTDRPDWAGRLWYSFYERGADMKDFCITALAYVSGQAPATLRPKPTWDLWHELLPVLRAKPYLLVLDGLERVLVAYHRSDAAQVQDGDVDTAQSSLGRAPRDCIRPDDGDLLRQLVGAGPSKILITSRLMPVALTNAAGPLPGVRHEPLKGLDQADAALMLNDAKITGDAEAMGRFLDQQFGCHPLVVGIVAGLVVNWPTAPLDFDRWVAAPDGGAAVDLTSPDIVQRRTHILRVAFDGLDPRARELIARIAMIANAVPLDVLEALNPARPPPPEAVPNPGPWFAERLFKTRRLREQLAKAKAPEQRADLERQIRDRVAVLTTQHQAAQQAYAAYQAALTSWPQSQPVRDAKRWLDNTLADLRTRGLLQWDRSSNLFDLHPVVRGYAVGMLDGEARARSGQHVADLFAARAEPAYEEATGLADLANPIQTVRALNLAGKVKEAWDVLNGGPADALHRLELHHEWLALLQPLFLNGWSAPAVGVEDAGVVASDAAMALKQVGFRREAAVQEVFSIQADIRSGLSANLSISLRNHSITLRDTGDLKGRERLLGLARAVAASAGDAQQAIKCDVFQAQDLTNQGRLTEARTFWSRLAPDLPGAMRQHRQFEAQARHNEAWLLFREGALTPDHLRATLDRLHALGERTFERSTLALAGEWHQSQGRHIEAIEAFAQAIAMAHEVHLRDTESEARRGLSLAKLGSIEEAQAAADSAERDPPHAALASLYRALNQPDKARDHALKGHEWAWANGPPYVHHWELEECRAVLRALNVPEPERPPFDPAKHPPFPWEANIHRMLEEHARKKREDDESLSADAS